MTLHLIKLCVGCGSPDELQEWIKSRLDEKRRRGEPAEHLHTTRMTPKRTGELTRGGSLYWVIRGSVQCRQRLLEIRPFTDAEGISRCHLVLEPVLICTEWQPRRPFQGWRYLKAEDAPPDLEANSDTSELPNHLRCKLTELGLL
ncbi:DUF1489 family protein [Chelativorans sp. Marseille-P2723]|uniref:DUF1489 family protein n=1 Tax=Chelativorans sp. Marseille-P2723 TaxID=2709133 RepID=UPI0015712172|nr:DUF1489 family protein [Chelativorans sp. Marseille-P2723]